MPIKRAGFRPINNSPMVICQAPKSSELEIKKNTSKRKANFGHDKEPSHFPSLKRIKMEGDGLWKDVT
ncbi:hypothetical protein BTO30_15185 [Domibacillus antri]|uniref:Uncharacterized protein n=1 Tax=Domibacillus antri TaxID=1714264 RepID=A0A1Q8Q223_9BACI|nr:hypothetical protein BTO30_15185 [Domibacillus antri]